MKGAVKKQIRSIGLRLILCTLPCHVVGFLVFLLTADARADMVTHWNEIALATQAAVPGAIRTPPAARALAMVHLAIFDSVNAIDRRFTPYVVDDLADPTASPEAAAAGAAHA